MINFFRRDYASVKGAVKFFTGDKLPEWVIVIWYILMLPLGLMLYPIVKLWTWWELRKLKKWLKED